MRVKMCSVYVTNPAGAYGFYRDVLGFRDLRVLPEIDLFIVSSPLDPDLGVLLEPSEHPVARAYREGLYAAGLPCIVFGVPDVAAEFDRLVAAGVRFVQAPTTDTFGTTAVFDDGFGNLIQLHQD